MPKEEDAPRRHPYTVKGGEKMYRVGGSTGVFGRLKTVPPGTFHSADIQTVEGAMAVPSADHMPIC